MWSTLKYLSRRCFCSFLMTGEFVLSWNRILESIIEEIVPLFKQGSVTSLVFHSVSPHDARARFFLENVRQRVPGLPAGCQEDYRPASEKGVYCIDLSDRWLPLYDPDYAFFAHKQKS